MAVLVGRIEILGKNGWTEADGWTERGSCCGGQSPLL